MLDASIVRITGNNWRVMRIYREPRTFIKDPQIFIRDPKFFI